MLPIEMPPLYLEALDPSLQEFLILAPLDPFADSFLHFFICAEKGYRLFVLSHLSSIPVTSLGHPLQISAQLLREFCERTDLERQALLQSLASHLEGVGEIL
jgi:hypothetical protein